VEEAPSVREGQIRDIIQARGPDRYQRPDSVWTSSWPARAGSRACRARVPPSRRRPPAA